MQDLPTLGNSTVHTAPYTPMSVRVIPHTPRKKIIPLTAVRGVAALMIYALHIWRIDYAEPLLVLNLRCVVTLFFVLSGFIMVHCYHTCTFQRWQCKFSFLIRRFARIYSPLMFAYVWTICLFRSTQSFRYNALRLATAPLLVYSLVACTEDGFFGDFTHHWAVSVEFLFYVLLALLFPVFRHAYRKADVCWRWWCAFWIIAPVALYAWIAIPIFASFAAGFPTPYTNRACQLYLLFPFRLPECLLGVWIGYLSLRYVQPAWRHATAAARQRLAIAIDVTLMAVGVVVVYVIPKADAVYGTHLVDFSHSGILVPLSMLTVLLLSLDTGLVAAALRWRPLEVLGEISYEIYLIHFSVVATLAPFIGFHKHNFRFILSLPVTLLVSYVLARYYSEPLYRYILSAVTRKYPDVQCRCKETKCAHQGMLVPVLYPDVDSRGSHVEEDGEQDHISSIEQQIEAGRADILPVHKATSQ